MAKGDMLFEVYGVKAGREDVYLGSVRTLEEARRRIEDLKRGRGAPEKSWREKYDDFVFRTRTSDTDFEIPPLPTPRQRYTTEIESIEDRPGTWPSIRVHILRDGLRIHTYTRNYGMLQTFEPFRQSGRDFALVAPRYTAASVMDLETGEIIASEEDRPDCFCPVGFYVPDWHDVNDLSAIPGSRYWDEDREWPVGDFGFVWGCYWGDDASWKVQYLDLSGITRGKIVREERFGYVKLNTRSGNVKDFIQLEKFEGKVQVRFAVELDFDLETGVVDERAVSELHHGPKTPEEA